MIELTITSVDNGFTVRREESDERYGYTKVNTYVFTNAHNLLTYLAKTLELGEISIHPDAVYGGGS